ncbi:MAG TPA: septum site-determining protein MinC [Thermoanaerobacterales bacterium]|nr:septum site-determining protein MinC [Thermoanaerobacterales bacterium]
MLILKGTKDGLLITSQNIKDISEFEKKLSERFKKSKDFFVGADVIIDLGEMEFSIEDKQKIIEIIEKDHFMNLKEIRNYNCRQRFLKKEPSIPATNTFFVKKTLRSGQKINYDGNIVILGDVNPGAEIIATGDIFVFGVLRGIAHAGATGDNKAVVTAFRLQPTQLRIANKISRAPDGMVFTPSFPEVAFVKDERIYIEPYFYNLEKSKEGMENE